MPRPDSPEIVEAPTEKLEALRRMKAEVADMQRRIAALSPPAPRPWHSIARPEQLPPSGDWSTLLIMAGRGFGKTRCGAEWVAEQAARNPDTEWAVIAPTWRDARKVCFEGDSGLIKSLLPGEFESVNLSDLQLRLTNGSRIYGYSADRPDRLRGSNLSGAWIDELAAMPHADDLLGEALLPALRIGDNPRVFITTTPRPIKVLRELVARTDGTVRVIRGSTWDNAKNLSKRALAELRARYEGTRMGRQELEAELLEDMEGALWGRDILDHTRVDRAPELARIVIGVDPAVTSSEESDYTGIVVCGKSASGHLYVLQDATMKGTPVQCMLKVAELYKEWNADRVVGEVNNGGDYIGQVLHTVDPNIPYRPVRASRGKVIRAEPISALWEQDRAHIVGVWPRLEDQMCMLAPDAGPEAKDDAVDACFVAGTPVLTNHGEIPIEDIRPWDTVWTRDGWRPVLHSALTRRDAAVMTVELSNGRRLTGTPNHRVWTGTRGWVTMDALVWGDTVSGWITPSPSPSAASSTPATRTPNSVITASTTSPPAPVRPGVASTSTATCGALRTRENESPHGGTSTTSTRIRSTTTPRTSNSSAHRPTPPRTPGVAPTRSARTWIGSVLSRLRGTAVPPGSSGTAPTAPGRGTTGSTSPDPATAAESTTAPPSASNPATAPGPASTASTTVRTATGFGSRALSAAPSSGSPSTGRSPRPAAVRVLSVSAETVRRDVYDLMVAGRPEFVAAGIIVHNCVWAAVELQVGASAMLYLSAISKVCNACDMPNRKSDTSCRGCGDPLTTTIEGVG